MANDRDIFKKARKLTPPGTPPNPTRRNTKHKRPEHGLELMARAVARRKTRPERHSAKWLAANGHFASAA